MSWLRVSAILILIIEIEIEICTPQNHIDTKEGYEYNKNEFPFGACSLASCTAWIYWIYVWSPGLNARNLSPYNSCPVLFLLSTSSIQKKAIHIFQKRFPFWGMFARLLHSLETIDIRLVCWSQCSKSKPVHSMSQFLPLEIIQKKAINQNDFPFRACSRASCTSINTRDIYTCSLLLVFNQNT